MSVSGELPFASEGILCIKEEVETSETQFQEQIFDGIEIKKSGRAETRSGKRGRLCREREDSQSGLNDCETNKEHPYKCNFCPKNYASPQGLRQHLKKHQVIKLNDSKEHKCPICSKTFKQMQGLHYHVNNHNETRPFECNKCPKAFSNPSSLWNHVERYHSNRIFPCRKCGKEFLSHSNRWEHERTVHDTEKRFKCSMCNNKSFASIKLLNRHIARIHNAIKPPVKKNHICSICAKAFRSKSKLEGHMNSHMDNRPYACTICPKKYRRPDTLSQHKLIHDSITVEAKVCRPRFKCTLCEKSYNSRIRLQSHMNFHLGERPFKCETCAKTFISKELLSSHTKIHSNDRKFECTLCNKKFNFNSDRRKHEKTHSNNRMNYQCENCKKFFNLKDQYHSHLEYNKCEKKSQECKNHTVHATEESFQCSQCDMETFTSIELLNRHTLEIHSRRKTNYKCSICEKSFRSRYNLDSHMNSHTDIRSYSCTICAKKYGSPVTLRRHKLTHDSLSAEAKTRSRFKCTLCDKSYNSRIRLNIHMNFHRGVRPFKCENCPMSFMRSTGLSLVTQQDTRG